MNSAFTSIKSLFGKPVSTPHLPSPKKQHMVGQAVTRLSDGEYIYFNSKGECQTTPEKRSRVEKLCDLVQKKKPQSSLKVFRRFAEGFDGSISEDRRAMAGELMLHLLYAPRNSDGALQMTPGLRKLVNGTINPNSGKPAAPAQGPAELNGQESNASARRTDESEQLSPIAADSSQTPSIAMKRQERKLAALASYEQRKQALPEEDFPETLSLKQALEKAEEATYDALMAQRAVNSAWALLTALPNVETCKTPLEKAHYYIHNTNLLPLLGDKQREWFIEHYLDLHAENDKQKAAQPTQ